MKITIKNFYHKYQTIFVVLIIGLYSLDTYWKYLFSNSIRATICSAVLTVLTMLIAYCARFFAFDINNATWKQLFSAAGIFFLWLIVEYGGLAFLILNF
ncbi:hypothetical protein OZX69_07010 [Lactobacillus sp. ESL0731]|uniref:hypothetical protein n=1 Tax=unclassified Lactobacillus TaxID=2620435 RepID=UPI0023F9C950|nr:MULTISPECIES: hypothetical protein [unclassified Lactobacillus]WEV50695.1 hypothetical protein OZX63_07005 [Lactobacillus sp. ESL0700]WEV61825.1 hypothetical protein OZX69_07010 [Lactobacillus sp. ESL0731]